MAFATIRVAGAAHAATGANPSVAETLGCLGGCTDGYVVKCLQASRTMTVTVRDDVANVNGLTAALVGASPLQMLGQAAAGETQPGGPSTASLVLTRPGAEGTMKALATVAAFAGTGPRSYTIDVRCTTAGGTVRSSSIVLEQDQ